MSNGSKDERQRNCAIAKNEAERQTIWRHPGQRLDDRLPLPSA
jgi:hypothetical protein